LSSSAICHHTNSINSIKYHENHENHQNIAGNIENISKIHSAAAGPRITSIGTRGIHHQHQTRLRATYPSSAAGTGSLATAGAAGDRPSSRGPPPPPPPPPPPSAPGGGAHGSRVSCRA